SHLPATPSSLSLSLLPVPPSSTLFPYTTLFRSLIRHATGRVYRAVEVIGPFTLYRPLPPDVRVGANEILDHAVGRFGIGAEPPRSEEHTSELQSHLNLVCRLLLEKKKKNNIKNN